MGLSKVWLVPFLTFVLSTSAFFISYLIAIYKEHVKAIWPYISDAGNIPPESCLFSQLLNLSAVFLACSIYLRHRQIVEFYWHQHQKEGRWRAISCFLLFLGYASAFGVSMVANFQEKNVLTVHYAGALLAFGCGLIYSWIQTIFSYRMNPKLAKPIVSHCRLFLCMSATVFFCSMIVFGPILGVEPKKHNEKETGHLYKWTGQEDNYVYHVVGTCSEWLLAICFQLYILSFAIELRHAYCHAPKLRLIAYYCDSTSSESALSFSSANAVTCCSGFTTADNKVKTYDSAPVQTVISEPIKFNIEMADLEAGSGLRSSLRNEYIDLPLGFDTADFVDPARDSSFDKSLDRIKF